MKKYTATYNVRENNKIVKKNLSLEFPSNKSPFPLAKEAIERLGGTLVCIYEDEYIIESFESGIAKTYI